MSVYRGNYWGMDTGDWSLDADDAFFLQSSEGDAELRIDTYDTVTPARWREMVDHTRARARPGGPIEEIERGQFAGITYEHPDEDGKYCREWLLDYAGLVLFVTLICERDVSPARQMAVDDMLSTLVECRP